MKTKHISDSFYQMYNFTYPTVKEGESVYWDSWGTRGEKIIWCVCQKSFGNYM